MKPILFHWESYTVLIISIGNKETESLYRLGRFHSTLDILQIADAIPLVSWKSSAIQNTKDTWQGAWTFQ